MQLGIDIVDIKVPSFRQRDEKSLRLIQCEGDVLIQHEMIFWILWSAKEAVFKYQREAHNFRPTIIPIRVEQTPAGITFQSGDITGKIEITPEYVLAVCGSLKDLSYTIFDDKNENWESGIRFLIVDYFRENQLDYHIGSDSLNLPTVEPGEHRISISHHGRFGAVAFPKSLL